MTQPISQTLSRLWHHMSQRRRRQFALLLFLMILSSFAEILSISAVLPFLSILTDQSRVFVHPAAQPVIQALGLTEAGQLLLPLTIAFGLAALVAGAMRLLVLWVSTKLSYSAGADISISIYSRTLYQPYSVHVARNSSEIIDGITSKTNNAIFLINMTLNLISSSVMLIAILIALLYVDLAIALAAFGGFGLIYVFVIGLTRNRLLINSQTVARESTYVVKSLQEGLGGIRDVLIDGSQDAYCQIYSNADQRLRLAQGNNQFLSSSPRSGVEALGMLLIAALACILAQQPEGIGNAIPIMGAMALGAQRLLPTLQQAYGSWASIQGGQQSLQDTLKLLDQSLPHYVYQPAAKPLSFRQEISLKQISFRYSPQTPWILKNIDLTIAKGSRVGFVGVTGSGKSTLLDIVMGLLQPSKGTIQIDGHPITPGNHRAWQAHIAHVPQAIFLADSSIEENIAFGVPKAQIDHVRVQQAARQAQIADIIESWPDQYQSFVGERGIRLSGGQRQRIGVARALYKKADVIIFDEATSSLDNETELAVMQAVENLGREITILLIAHRLTTLQCCDIIYCLEKGNVLSIGGYDELISIPNRVFAEKVASSAG